MLQVINHTPFGAALSVFPDPQGVETVYVVVKATFLMGAEGPELATPQLPLLATDMYWGDPTKTSLRAAGDFGLLKPATDVLLVGRAIAPAPNTRVADVTLRVGSLSRTVRVFGDRCWEKTVGGWRPSAPQVWERMPLRWELAWGGVATAVAQEVPDHEPRNPIGKGLPAHNGKPSEAQPLPNLEDPKALLNDPEDRPTPACFAPLPPTWQPRCSYAGTYDDAWMRQRAPFLPLDFDPRFFQLAPPALIAPSFLQGGEAVVLSGFSKGAPIQFELPSCGLALDFDFDGASVAKLPQLEMLLFEPDAGRFQMLWRAALSVDKKLLKLRSVVVSSSAFGQDGSRGKPLRAGETLACADAPAA